MTKPDLQRMLGSDDPDPGCDHSGEMMDEYCELVYRGAPVPPRLAEFVTHIGNCVACREDTDGLLAMLRATDGEEG